MHQQIVFGDAVFADGHHFRMRAVHANPTVAVLAEDHRLAVLEIKHAIRAHASFGKGIKGVIVEDVAVLIDLDKRDAFVPGGGFDHAAQMFDVDVDRARHEGRLAGDGQRKRIDRIVDRAHRRRLGLLAKLRGRAVLAFGQTINAVVEENVVDVEVAANRMHEVVAADRERVAVAGDHPDAQSGFAHLMPVAIAGARP